MTITDWLGEENKIGVDIWEKKYRQDGESFDEWLDRVSDNNPEYRQLMIEKKFLAGGRILANRGLHKKGVKVTYSNCYVIPSPEDSIESIFDCAKQMARTFSYGGGVGIDISKLAPRGAKVNNTAKQTSGSVSFMDLYSMVTGLIGQAGRRGALMISIACDHPDVEEFVELKSDLDKVTKANISVRVTKDFMDAVINNGDFKLSFTRAESGETIEKTIKANDLFNRLCYMNWDYAEPGILFWDRIKNWNLLSNNPDFHYGGVNPCVTGDTLILTDKGYKPIKELCDKIVNVWNGYEFSEVTPHITGYNQQMKTINFSDGSSLTCTNYHKFILKDGERIEAQDLKEGDKLIKCNFPVIEGQIEWEEKEAYTKGFYTGDGSKELERNRHSIKLYGEKRKILPYLTYQNSVYCESFDGEFLTLSNNICFDKEEIPDVSHSIQTRLNWLAGYLDSDGTIQSKEGSISISSINKERLLKVKYMLNTLGINASVRTMYEEGEKLLPKNDGTDEKQNYHVQQSYRLLISAYNAKKLLDLGLNTHRLVIDSNPNRDASRFITIESIRDAETCPIVYCFNEPKNHSGIFNGVITAQCAEEPLPEGGSCCLGSINLAEFVREDKTFDYDDFKKTVRLAVRFLNDILDEGLELHPLEIQRQCVNDWKQIGLGIMGLADALIKMELTYGSFQAAQACDEIGHIMIETAIDESANLAKEKGAYPKYDERVIESPFFVANVKDSKVIENVRANGLRNSQLLTCAPTGTLSTLLEISGGIEPIFANYYTRKTESLHGEDRYYKIYTPIVKKYMEEHNIEDDTDLPEWFITSPEIQPINRIIMQGTWQKYIDASISSTVNLPNEATQEEVRNIYIQAYQHGLKGITIYRSGCKREGILVATPTKEEKTEPVTLSDYNAEPNLPWGTVLGVDDDLLGMKRKIINGCGAFHLQAFYDEIEGRIWETFISLGDGGGCERNLEFISKLMSKCLRAGVPIEEIIETAKSGRPCMSYCNRARIKGDTSAGISCPSAIGRALEDFNNKIKSMYTESADIDDYADDEEEDSVEELTQERQEEEPTSVVHEGNLCPECGEPLVHEGGCDVCRNCGYSHCG